jgi:hypothetical protein
MAFFLIAALAMFLAWEPLKSWWTSDPKTWLHRHRHVLAVATTLLGGIILYAARVGSPEITQIMLGALAGIMSRTFPEWLASGKRTVKERVELEKWRLLLFAGGLSVLTMLALAAPYAEVLLQRLSRFEIASLKVELVTRTADKQIALNIDRNIGGFEELVDILRSTRFTEFECSYTAFAKMVGLKAFMTDQQYQQEYRRYPNALAFRHNIIGPFVAKVVKGQRHGYNTEVLKVRIRSVANKLFDIVFKPQSPDEKYQEALDEIHRQVIELNDEIDGFDWERQEENDQREKERRPCVGQGFPQSLALDDFRDLVNNTRYVHGITAGLLLFTDNVQAASRAMQKAKENVPALAEDINVNLGIAELRYLAERKLTDKLDEKTFEEIASVFYIALTAVEIQALKVTVFLASGMATSSDKEAGEELRKRYSRAALDIKREMAFFFAQEGVQLSTAQEYARESYKMLQIGRLTQFYCTDNFMPVDIEDKYAFAKLAQQTYNLHTFGEQPNVAEVREAYSVLESARKRLKNMNVDICFADKERRDLWDQRVFSHMKLAEAMLR